LKRLKGCVPNGENKGYNIILKLIWYKQGVKGWDGLDWLRIGPNKGLCDYNTQVQQSRKFLVQLNN
jgi:hypothetical protein